MDGTVTYKCPNCDAGLIFSPDKQRFVCEFCISDFTEEELKAGGQDSRAEEAERDNAEFSAEINEYNCPSCGAEIIADVNTIADTCCYCHNPIVISEKASGILRPSKIIPFKFDKAEAKSQFLRFAKKKWFAPRDYASEANAENITGIYYPFWVTDADTEANMDADATKVRSWRVGDYAYTETSRYSILRGGDIHFEDITTAAISEDESFPSPFASHSSDMYSLKSSSGKFVELILTEEARSTRSSSPSAVAVRANANAQPNSTINRFLEVSRTLLRIFSRASGE